MPSPAPHASFSFCAPQFKQLRWGEMGDFWSSRIPSSCFLSYLFFCSVFFFSFLAFSFPSTESCLCNQHNNYQADYSLKDISVFKIMSHFYHPHALSAVKISNLPTSPDRAEKREREAKAPRGSHSGPFTPAHLLGTKK